VSLLRQKILDAALHSFSEKGYTATSIQEIASECGIAKGSVYKFFASKEQLLIEAYESRMRLMFEQAKRIGEDESLSPRERFVRETLHQFEFVMEFKSYLQDFHEQSLQAEGNFDSFVQRLRAVFLDYFKGCLHRAYGSSIEPHIWDLVLLYVGILKQFTMLPLFMNHPIDLKRASEYIADRMDEITAGILQKNGKPIVKASFMREFVQCGLQGMPVTPDQRIADLLQDIASAVRELNETHGRKAELQETVELLREELEKEEPRRALVRALFLSLHTQHELKPMAGQLEKLTAE
jgi:AcrR family transcriptional regulator